MIDDVIFSPLSIIETKGGDVLHAMKVSDKGFNGFGEAYFSTIKKDSIKAWKRHRKMTLNLIVPIGGVRFVIYDDRISSTTKFEFKEIILSRNRNYGRLTIPPMLWVGFQGLSKKTSILLNVANIEHSSNEVDRKELNKINFNWEKK